MFIVGGIIAIIVGSFMIRGTMHLWDKPESDEKKDKWGNRRFSEVEILLWFRDNMVRPQDSGFGFDQSKKYTSVENLDEVCVQCQAGQHKKCLAKAKQQKNCECEHCMIYGW